MMTKAFEVAGSVDWPQQRRDDYAAGYEFARSEVVAEGREAWWCEEHKASNNRPDFCDYADLIWQTTQTKVIHPCRMVRVRVVPYNEEG